MVMAHPIKTLRIVAVLLICSTAQWPVRAQQGTELYRRIANQSVEVDGQQMPRLETDRSWYHVRLDGMKLTKEEFASLAGWTRIKTIRSC